jgi:hypothetical protein
MTTRTTRARRDPARHSSEDRRFPGWRWAAVGFAFPIAGYIGWGVSGPVDAVGAALLGGALTGAGLGAVQWWAAKKTFGPAGAWIGASAVGYAAGLAVGAALVGYGTDLADLALMGLISGVVLGIAQAVALARHGNARLAAAWGAAMPALLALGWCASTGIGISVEDQFTVFGAAGALLFTLLSALVLARFGSPLPDRPTPRS